MFIMDKNIVIKGAREHNLKNIDVTIPRDKMVVLTGLSGSGKSSLAFDTIYAEGQKKYVESLSSYARQFLGLMKKPDVQLIEGLSPAISIDQKTTNKNPRSTVGTVTEIYDYLRLLYARIGIPHCPICGRVIESQSIDSIIESIQSREEGTRLTVFGPVIRGRKGEHKNIIDRIIPITTMNLHFVGKEMRHISRYEKTPDVGLIYMLVTQRRKRKNNPFAPLNDFFFKYSIIILIG